MTDMLAEISPLVGIIARQVTDGNPSLQDDAQQEGLIAAWQASLSNPDAPKQYLIAAARNGIKALPRGRQAFGAPKRSATSVEGVSLDALTDAENESSWDAPDPGAEQVFDTVLSEITFEQMLTPLPPEYREVVRVKFGENLDWQETAERVGRASGNSLHKTWVKQIKPRLREHLLAA